MDITEIAGYRVIRELGAGGMGQVFLVQHPRLPRRDALKLLDAGVSRNDDFKARFQREADLLAQLSHPNIVTLHDRGEVAGRLWITMEYVDGTDTAELLKSETVLDPDLAISLVAGAAAALDFAWRKQKITHRDVKPANILVGIDDAADGPVIESVKLADFGIAKAAGEATSLTSTGMTVGTMQYISPEAIEGEEVDNRSDIYSLGCTAFHLLTGQPPFTETSIASTMSAHLIKPVPQISKVAPHLPEAMDAVFDRVLAKNPAHRYQFCAEFVAALQEAAGGEARDPALARTIAAALPNRGVAEPAAPTQLRKDAVTAAPQPKSRVPILAAAVSVVAVAAALLGFYATRQESSHAPATPVVSTTATTTETTTSAVPSPTSVVPTAELTSTAPPTTTTVIVAPTPRTTDATTPPPSPSIYAGMPCNSPGARSPDGRFGCSGENLIWVDLDAPPLPTIGWDAIGQPCTSPGAKARLEASDGVLTCKSTGGDAYVWVSGPY